MTERTTQSNVPLYLGTLCIIAVILFAARHNIREWFRTSPLARSEVEMIVRDYIIAHPELITETLEQSQRQRLKTNEMEEKKALTSQQQALYHNPKSPVYGAVNAEMQIVEFYDYRCSYCKQAAVMVARLLERDSTISFILKPVAFLGAASEHIAATALALHAKDPKRFEAFHHRLLFGMKTPNSLPELAKILTDIGEDSSLLDSEAFAAARAEVAANTQLAHQLGIHHMPSFVVGEYLSVGADPRSLEKYIQRYRQQLMEEKRKETLKP